MKQIQVVGLALLTLLALGVVAASAEEGALPLFKKGVNFLATNWITETHGKEKLKCAIVSGSGKFESDSHGAGTLDFLECEAFGFPAFSLGEKEPKTIKEALILIPILFLVCLVDTEKLLFGLFIELRETVHTHIKAIGVLFNLKGSFIAHVLPNGGKFKLWTLDLEGKEGLGNISQCFFNKEFKPALLLVERDPEAPVGESIKTEKALVQFEEEIEFMDA